MARAAAVFTEAGRALKKKPTKTKKVTITIPEKFKWQARQATGEWFFSVEKPFLEDNGDRDPDTNELYQWWAAPRGENDKRCDYLELDVDDFGSPDNWKGSLRKI
jgi:hypothetical protein